MLFGTLVPNLILLPCALAQIERVIPKKKKYCQYMNMVPLTHQQQGRHAELFFPVVMMNCAEWAIWFLLGSMAHIFYITCQFLRYNIWPMSRAGIFSSKHYSSFTQSDNIKSQNKITKIIHSRNKCFIFCWEPLDFQIFSYSFIHSRFWVLVSYDRLHVNQILISWIFHAFLPIVYWSD